MIILWRLLDLFHAFVALILFPIRFTKWGRERVAFETKRMPPLEKADWAFEVSSEGEFEQVRPWIEVILSRGQNIELVYASPSVLKTVENLASHYPKQIRLFPLPLLTHTPWVLASELMAPRWVLCRYDFFPSVMSRATVSSVRSGVVWASFKNRRERVDNRFWRFWYRGFFGTFDWVIPATGSDESLFKRLGAAFTFPHNEMRVFQIQKRLSQRMETLRLKFPKWERFNSELTKFSRQDRWILGSAWEVDLAFLLNPNLQEDIKQGRVMVMVVPHKLGPDWKNHISERFQLPVTEITTDWDGSFTAGSVCLINLKGVLCELYSEAGHVYVGGGFGRSVHSVMEPFVAGARVWCGPGVHRSTEVECIQEVAIKDLTILADQSALTGAYDQSKTTPYDLTPREHWLENQRERLIKNLEEVEKLC